MLALSTWSPWGLSVPPLLNEGLEAGEVSRGAGPLTCRGSSPGWDLNTGEEFELMSF